MEGTLFGDLDKGDLLNLGISSLKHRVAIMKHIKGVISISPQMSEGYNAAPTAYI